MTEENNNKIVKIYSTPTCMYCTMLKEYLEKNGKSFEDINVSENQEAARYVAEKTGQLGVPVTEIDGQFIIGFDQKKIAEILGIEN